MTSGSVARRYARALYDLASEEGSVAPTSAALAEFADALTATGTEQFAEGVLDHAARVKVGEALAARVGRETLLGRFLRLVAERDRLDQIPAIAQWYGRLEDEAAGRVRLAVTAAGELSDADVEAIRAAFRAIVKRDVVAVVSKDPELLGGAIVEVEGRVYDGSVKTALSRLASRMAGTTK